MAVPNLSPARAMNLGAWLRENSRAFVLPAICLLPVLLTLPFMNEPLERDEGTYATIAQALMHGAVPYRDLLDHKPPLIYVWYAISFVLFGQGIVAPRLMAALVWSVTTIVVHKQGKLLFSELTATAGATIFAISSALVLLQANANTEAFMVLPLTCSLYAFTRALKEDAPAWLLGAGVCGGLAVLTKQVAGLNLAAGGLFVVWYSWKEAGVRRALLRGVVLCAGFATVLAIALLPFVLTRSLGDFFYANWTYNRLYAAELSMSQRFDGEMHGLRFVFVVAGPLLLLALLGCIAALRDRSRELFLLLAWLAATYAGIALSGRAFPHYYVSLIPVLALLAGYGVVQVRSGQRSTTIYLAVLALSGLLCLSVNAQLYLQPTPEAKHSLRFSGVNPEPQNTSPRLAAYVDSVTQPTDLIYNYGRETQLYFYADRRPASRFIYDRPFWLDPPTFDVAMKDLQTRKPRLILDSVSARSDPDWEATHPPAFQDLLDSAYEYVGHIEFADVYRLK
jgi:4-amino-4-deoxy-L-arabinose transferase-like glycosyltransferase